MAISIDRSWYYASPFIVALIRTFVGTPLDVVATREILLHQNTRQILRGTPFSMYRRGFGPNLVKFSVRTPVEFCSMKIASSAVPLSLDPAVRGIGMGILKTGMEVFVINIFNALRTRFIQGQGWGVIQQEGVSVLTKGLSAAFAHRASSSAIFMGTYEKLKENSSSNPAILGTLSGIIQVVSTSPFYIATTRRQRKNAFPERLDQTLTRLYSMQGLLRGVVLPGLAPRLVHSVVISGPLMWVMEKLQLIHRKT
jgi:hypothetical protein